MAEYLCDDGTKCLFCGSRDNVETWVLGPYSMTACQDCGENRESLSDGCGNRPERYRDAEARRFSEGVADMIKLIERELEP